MQRRYADNGTNHEVVLEKWGLRRRYSWGWDGKDQERIENMRSTREDIKEGIAFSKLKIDQSD